MQLTGLHHVTAISAAIRENYRFYTQVLGMRLVKRSVNQDDVSAYHLFYADAAGSPGTDLTFFDWDVSRETRGTRSVSRTMLRVNGAGALEWWERHLHAQSVANDAVTTRDNRLTLDFEDGEGQRLSLVDDGGAGDEPRAWEQSTVPPEFQIRGLGPVVLSVPNLGPTEFVLTDAMNLRAAREYVLPGAPERVARVFEMGVGGPSAEVHVIEEPDAPVAGSGAGGVHHVAFRTPDEASYHAWTRHLRTHRIATSGEIDRYYFRSLYFREPNGILFEIATDGPGFATDEDPAHLGERVALPPFLEPRRAEILANLKPID